MRTHLEPAGSAVSRDDVLVATLPGGEVIRICIFESDIDGAAVIQVDTDPGAGVLRICLNDADVYAGRISEG